jgi:multidrug resistance protein MdtO
MAVVFDLVWPVRTVSAMRRGLASVLRADADLFRLVDSSTDQKTILNKADGFRDRAGKTIATLRSLNDVVAYEFGADREEQIHTGETILRAAFTAAGIFWNQLVVLHSEQDRDFSAHPGLTAMRSRLAQQIDAMAKAVVECVPFPACDPHSLVDPILVDNPRFGEYARNTVKQYCELEAVIRTLGGSPSGSL